VSEPATRRPAIVDVEVAPEICMNFRNCLRMAPGAFVTDPATKKTRPALWQRVDPEALWNAGFSCPTGAIRFVTEQGYVVPRWQEAASWDTARHPGAARRRDQPAEAP
jgi:ferredoxin